MTRHAAPSQPAVEVSGLSVRRGRADVLHGLEFTVPRGSVVGLLGPSGCGKTTLMRSIVGVQRGVRGTLSVLGAPAGHRSLRRRVAYMTQLESIYDDLTVRQNLDYFRRVVGADRALVDRVLEQTDLVAEAGRLAANLSGGQRNRVSLAAALLGEPELLVLDEPTVGLDPVLRVQLWELFHTLAATGTAILVSSHVMDEAVRCDRLLLIREGRILADETPARLLETTRAVDAETAFLRIIRGDGPREHHADAPRHGDDNDNAVDSDDTTVDDNDRGAR
ncbi:ABC transporter ATP-binding protein [Plantibacter sp. YIM 135347]|uniref:ABC transporter ATP-binding protein n=1 Tax=Plantibacter sp. YIM 135347 TaxID=3423919 RepID=UPI003D3399B6